MRKGLQSVPDKRCALIAGQGCFNRHADETEPARRCNEKRTSGYQSACCSGGAILKADCGDNREAQPQPFRQ